MSTLDFSQITAVKLNGDTVVRITDTVNTLWELQQPAVDYLSFTDQSNAANTLTLSRVGTDTSTLNAVNVEYSFDKSTWTPWTESSNKRTLTIPAGGTVYLRGTNSKFNIDDSDNYYAFSSTGNVAGGGDVSTLIAADGTATAVPDCFCYRMFRGMTTLTKAPAIGVSRFGYCSCRRMFYGCTSITAAPKLTITETAKYCCYSMFYGCSAMTTAANVHLNATDVGGFSYSCMFYGCTSLVTPPSFTQSPLSLSGDYSMSNMFRDCSSLKTAPAIEIASFSSDATHSCFAMFYYCTSLTDASNVVLSAPSLVKACYGSMFYNCIYLTQAPYIQATTLADGDGDESDGCLFQMFSICSRLKYIKVAFTSWKSSASYNNLYAKNWVYGITTGGTFECPSGLAVTRGTSYIPYGWSVVIAKTA